VAEHALHRHHGLDYVELAQVDLEAAKAFYGAAFGWTFTDYGPDYVGYCDGRTHDGVPVEAGGFRREATVATGGPLVILYSRTLAATRDAVKAAGGQLTKDIFAFPGGRRFQFLDPSGNELAVWSDVDD
jgi:predicted enzyme related to lactoylglutathione lyase